MDRTPKLLPSEPDGDTVSLRGHRDSGREAFGQATARLQQASGAAVSTLLKITVDVNAPHSTRVRAADCVLGRAGKAIEIEDIKARVRATT